MKRLDAIFPVGLGNPPCLVVENKKLQYSGAKMLLRESEMTKICSLILTERSEVTNESNDYDFPPKLLNFEI